jgi:NAD(P)-dependent dehydrogenase (short-subunit alcohol dehydrogenase family)
MNNSTDKKIWYITGASKGFGLSLTRKLLDQGYRVAATSRNTGQLKKLIHQTNNFLPLQVDLTKKESIQNSIGETIKHFGGLDVVVNNAGYGMGGAVEEFNNAELQEAFAINLFAPIYVMQAALPHLRKQHSGHVINISSIAGFTPFVGWSIYAATKYALTGITDVLAQDVKELNIKATVVLPGAFRTDFLSSNSLVLTENKIEEYGAVRESHKMYKALNGGQGGDPEKAVDILIQLAEMPQPPVYLFLGSDSYQRAKKKLAETEAILEEWKTITLSTDY